MKKYFKLITYTAPVENIIDVVRSNMKSHAIVGVICLFAGFTIIGKVVALLLILYGLWFMISKTKKDKE